MGHRGGGIIGRKTERVPTSLILCLPEEEHDQDNIRSNRQRPGPSINPDCERENYSKIPKTSPKDNPRKEFVE